MAPAPASPSDSVLRRGQSLAIWGVSLPHGQALVSENAGALLGRARFRGEVPETAPARPPAGSFCKERWKERPTVAVNAAGNLAGVVVYLSWGMAPQKVTEPVVVVEIRDCSFTHGVLGMVEGQSLRVTNKDSAEYQLSYPSRRGEASRRLEPGQVFSIADLESESHRVSLGFSEELYLRVVPHPYYSVSDRFGEFDIPLVPPGTYTATAWHPRLGTQEKLVSVLAGRHTEIDFEFGPGDLRR